MASAEPGTMDVDEATIIRGRGNVFADLGYSDAEERQTKLRLALRDRTAASDPGCGRGEDGRQSAEGIRARELQLDGFSVERLMTFLTALDQDVEIAIRQKTAVAGEWADHGECGLSVSEEVFLCRAPLIHCCLCRSLARGSYSYEQY